MKTPKWFDNLRNRGMAQATPPIIPTQYGPVTEAARLAAAMNMRGSREIRERVEEAVIQECGGDVTRGGWECRRRYPEAYAVDRYGRIKV